MLLHRLAENETIIRRSYEDVAKSVRQGHPQTPAAKWLVENFSFVEEQIDQVRLLFPPGYSRQLPVLGSGPLRHYPRVYDLAIELVAHTDGRVDAENIAQFIRAYQTVRPLKLGELWAVPIMASLALVENLRRVSRRIAWRRRQWGAAVVWSRRFIEAIQDDPKSLITILADFVKDEPVKSSPFLAELTASLQGTHPAMELVINWVEQELSERGQTLEMLQQAESQDQAADHASISHSIASLRQLGRIDWRETVESLSAVEAILLQDPGGTHGREDFRSRDLCRREIEDLSRRSGREERDVAATALRLATERAQRREADPREGTVGYYLVGEGRVRIEAEHSIPAVPAPARGTPRAACGAADLCADRRDAHGRALAAGDVGCRNRAAGVVAGGGGGGNPSGRVALGGVAGELVGESLVVAARLAAPGFLERHSGRAPHGGGRSGDAHQRRGGGSVAGTSRAALSG